MDQSRQRILKGRGTRGDVDPAPPTGRADPVDPAVAELQRFEAARSAYLDVARDRVAVGVDELERVVAERVGADPDRVTRNVVDDVEHDLMSDPTAPVVMLAPDVIVYAPALTDGIVLTHRLSAAERASDHLDVEPDLAGFVRTPDLRVATGPLHWDEPEGDDDPLRWGGPAGWLSEFPEGALLAVRVTADGAVTLSAVDAEPDSSPDLVAALRAVYDDEVAEPGLPVPADTLVLGMLHRDRGVFAEPRPPMGDLAAAAGLELRGGEYAHDEEVWATADEASRDFRLIAQLDTEEQTEAAAAALDLLETDPTDPAVLREVLGLLDDPAVLGAVAEELLREPDETGERVRSVVAVADRLVRAAGRSPREAIARWLAAVAAERDGRVLDAESHLRAAALAAEGWPLVEDRLAWYESDRGDAAAAAARWRAIEVPADDPDLAAVLPFAATTGPEPGRNDPCWCGSGRKYKQCHRGRPAQAPLPDRAPWLYRKAVTYVERRGGAAAAALDWWASALAGEADDPETVPDEMLVADMALSEGGWFARFLVDRGPLLPADEAELAVSWVDVRRSVFEVERVRFGVGATLRDLRGGGTVEVTAVATGRDLVVGELILARVLPDGSGSGRLLAGPVADVRRGTEDEVLAMLEEAADRRS